MTITIDASSSVVLITGLLLACCVVGFFGIIALAIDALTQRGN